MSDLISVIVPIYNVEEYIKQCIDSILSQSYKNLEIILIDDGSPDNCGIICDMYAQKDNRVVVIHQKNAGLACARNAGLARATGNYIGFVDSDDYIDKRMFEKLIAAIKERNAQIAICGYKTIGLENVIYTSKDSIYTKDEALRKLIHNYEIQSYAWNKLYCKKLFEKIQFPSGKRYEDFAIMHNVFMDTKIITMIHEVLYFYRIRKNSIVNTTKGINSLEYINSHEQRCNDLKDTKYYYEAREFEIIELRRILTEIQDNDGIYSENYMTIKKILINVMEKCSKKVHLKQELQTRFYLKFPQLYLYILKIRRGIRR